jgi:autotransporter-associated beta strand protein
LAAEGGSGVPPLVRLLASLGTQSGGTPLPLWAALVLVSVANAQQTTPPTGTHTFKADALYDPVDRQTPAATTYYIEDGITVTLQNGLVTAASTNGGVFNMTSNRELTIAPSGPLGTGKIIFQNNTGASEGGVFYTAAPLSVTNADFIGNKASTGGVHRSTTGAGLQSFTNVLFQGNSASSTNGGGVFRSYGNVSVTSGTFDGNYTSANTGVGGVLQNSSNSAERPNIFTNVALVDNRAARTGGVASYATGGVQVIVDATEISGNWAGQYGGVLYDSANRASGFFMNIRLSGSTGQKEFVYSGNAALGLTTPATVTATNALSTGSYALLGTPVANAGGFYYASGSTDLRFDIADGVSLAIGEAGSPAYFDSIATADTGTGALIDKRSDGRLVLHADNAYYQGLITVSGGALLLGNENARLGGVIEIAAGATLGGSGTLATLKQNSSVFAGRTLVTATGGATLRAGMDTATGAETLTISGSVILKDGAILGHDLFAGAAASLLSIDNLTQEANAIINLGLLETGTFTLVEWTSGGGLDADKLTLTVNGAAETARSSGSLFTESNQLKIDNSVSSLEMQWTGAQAGKWAGRDGGQNWSDEGLSGEKIFRDGDRVVFDGESDAAHPDSRAVSIDEAGVIVADMRVGGSADYIFQGAGGISADASTVDGALITGSGMLSKSGAGALVFANTGTNLFINGIDIAGGVLGFDRAGQLTTGAGSGIIFSDSGTLRAAAGVSGTLTPGIIIAAGKTAGIEVAAQGRLVYGGTLAGAADSSLRKSGGGALLLQGDSGANAGAVLVDEGVLLMDGAGAKLGGKISIATGALLGGTGELGTGGEVAVSAGAVLAAGIDSTQSGTLTVNNIKITGGVVFQFDLYNDADGAVKRSDRIIDAGTSQISGVNIIDITTLASGTFNLGNLTGLAGDYQVTLNDMVLPGTGRLSAALAAVSDGGGGDWLRLVTSTDKSRNVTWTGTGNASWSLTAENWAAGTDGAGVTQYGYGDHVIFDGQADAANPDNRVISIDGSQISISDMTVSADVNYTFTGNGGIVVRTDSLMEDGTPAEITDAQGKLVKSGSGTLTFANNAGNSFEGGIDISGGVIVFNRADHLGTTGTAITFTGDATLRAGADAMELDNMIIIESGKTGTVDSNARALALTGTLFGCADATFAKTGEGVLLLNADATAFSGTLAARQGVLRVGATDLLTASGAAAIVVDAGATLDLDGHNQTLSNLAGAGEVALGGAALAYAAPAGTTLFEGGFSGDGSVIKKGVGKWVLSGSSSHAGGVVYEEGELGLAGSFALGAGALTVTAPDAVVSIAGAGINVANDINVGTGGVTFSSGPYQAELSGKISGGAVAVNGPGTLVFSGNNSYASLKIENEWLVARRAEAVSGAVLVEGDSVLEFRDVAAGQVQSDITGNQVLFTSSTLSMLGTNQLRDFIVGTRADITAAATGALGGANANIIVRDGGALRITGTNISANNMIIDGGAIVFGADYKMNPLTLSGTMTFTNDGEVRLGTILPTGIYTAAVAAGGIPAAPAYDPHQGGMFMVLDIVDSNTLQITAYNMALEPGKDITVGFDAMLASMRSVYTHISEEFLIPLLDRKPDAPAHGLWFRAVGSFAKYGDDHEHLGYTDRTYAGIIGYDWISYKNFLLGGYAGYSSTRLETNNHAITDIDLPSAGMYGVVKNGNLYMTANLSAGFGRADTKRVEDVRGNIVAGSYDLDSAGGGVELGYMLHPFAQGGLRPSIGLQYMNLHFHDYKERGDQYALRVDNFQAHVWQARFGCEVSKEIRLPWGMPGMIDVNVGWRENLRSKVSDVRGTLAGYPETENKFQIRGDRYDPSGVTGGLGLRMMFSRKCGLSLAYDFDYIPAGTYDNDTVRHTFNSVIRLSW